ncbi:MAG TPA: nitrate reductase cytochrome c-type subunit [Azospirillum sp.]|nr:nitrate reductase cytochrome c-type subunit [Azospirillum sp.]
MKIGLKLIAAAVGLVLVAATMMSTGAPAGEIRSLRGELGVEENNAAPDIHNVREGKPLDRAYRQQPPLIPHKIDRYEIDLKVNQCLRCHDWPNNTRENAPKVSETHYQDRAGNRLDQIAGTRWFCTQCHVPQTDALPLVDNKFTPASAR